MQQKIINLAVQAVDSFEFKGSEELDEYLDLIAEVKRNLWKTKYCFADYSRLPGKAYTSVVMSRQDLDILKSDRLWRRVLQK